MKFFEINAWIDSCFPASDSAEWDNDGVEVCYSMDTTVQRVLFAVDFSIAALEYASAGSYDCIIAHHPLIYKPIKKLDGMTVSSRKALWLAHKDIIGVSIHTRLDAARGEANTAAALWDRLALGGSMSELGADGVGRVFELANNYSCGELFDHVSSFSPEAALHRNSGGSETIKRAAVVTGSGMDYYGAAKAAGADVFITGEGSYHDIADAAEDYNFYGSGRRYDKAEFKAARSAAAEGRAHTPKTEPPAAPHIITVGHYESEYPAMRVLMQKFGEAFPGMDTEIV